MTSPFFTVIIPTYNRLELCKQAIDSVLAQDFLDYEIIVVDDGSIDKTSQFFEQLHDHRVQYFYKENDGVSSARNEGVKQAKGQYICYLDSDDIWNDTKLSAIHDVIVKHQPEVLIHDFRKHDLKKAKAYTVSNTDMFNFIFDYSDEISKKTWQCSGDSLFELVLRGYPFYPSVLTIRRDIHHSYLWDPCVLRSEDFNLILKLSLKYNFMYLDECLAIVRIHGSNKSADSFGKMKVEIKTINAVKDLYCKNSRVSLANYYMKAKMLALGRMQFRDKKYSEALWNIGRALSSSDFVFTKAKRKLFVKDKKHSLS